jgi:hypothetical protein
MLGPTKAKRGRLMEPASVLLIIQTLNEVWPPLRDALSIPKEIITKAKELSTLDNEQSLETTEEKHKAVINAIDSRCNLIFEKLKQIESSVSLAKLSMNVHPSPPGGFGVHQEARPDLTQIFSLIPTILYCSLPNGSQISITVDQSAINNDELSLNHILSAADLKFSEKCIALRKSWFNCLLISPVEKDNQARTIQGKYVRITLSPESARTKFFLGKESFDPEQIGLTCVKCNKERKWRLERDAFTLILEIIG